MTQTQTQVPANPAGMSPTFDEARLQELLGRALVDFGATFNAPLILIGDRLGLYKAMAGGEPLTPAELAARTGTAERYIREWLRPSPAPPSWASTTTMRRSRQPAGAPRPPG